MTNAQDYFSTLLDLLMESDITDIQGKALSVEEGSRQIVNLLLEIKASGRKAMVIGNGGSAAIASHMHNDISKMVGAKAISFYETPLLTALSNDEGYDVAFDRQAHAWAEQGDLLVAISSSGQSTNILNTVRTCLGRDCHVVTLSGFQADNSLRQLGHYNIYLPSSEYGYVECGHQVWAHYLTDRAAGATRHESSQCNV